MTNIQILEEAADWLVEMRDGQVDAAKREGFVAWLRRSPENVQAYLELDSRWADAASVDPKCVGDAQALIERMRVESNVVSLEDRVAAHGATRDASRESRSIATWLIAACAAVVCIAVGIGSWQLNRATYYATGIGEQRSITLEDSSRVELNSRSRIRIQFSANERLVELIEGQGMFQVAKDPRRPFVVRSDGARVRAVGTQFDVYRKPGGTIVTVLEGKVELEKVSARSLSSTERLASGSLISPVRLAAGEQAIIEIDQITRPKRTDIAAATAWTQKELVFDSATLAEVAHEFNRYNLRPLVVGDAQLEAVLISGVFSSADPSSLLRFLRAQPDFVVHETNKEVRIALRD